MDNEMKAALLKGGVDVDDLMNRMMGNMGLITRFYKRFPEDKCYVELIDAMEKDDAEEAFKAAHTLKGLTANLSMKKLYSVVCDMVDALRQGDMETAQQQMPQVITEYESMVDVIKSIEWN